MRTRPDDGTGGHQLLLQFLRRQPEEECIALPLNFFDPYLNKGEAIVLLDGMDEVADPEQRRRVARLIESFVHTCVNCRYVVTRRIVGYDGAAQLREAFKTITVRSFNLADIGHFLTHCIGWWPLPKWLQASRPRAMLPGKQPSC